jgi:adenine-specific DNA-methyltransferase
MLDIGTWPGSHDIVLDFFAGSGTSAHAAMLANANDGGHRKWILVQLDERLDPNKKEQREAAEFCDRQKKPRNIAELTKERLRRAGKQVKKDNPKWKGDTGFRVFKLDSSNIKAWDPTTDDVAKDIEHAIDHLKADRSEQDILYEMLLKLGLDLCVPMETKAIAGKQVHSIGGGVLMACLDKKIERKEAEKLALGIADWHKKLNPAGDTTCVFRDSAFTDDVAKTNLAAILNQHGITTIRSI